MTPLAGKTVIVTGGAGFLGSVVVERLRSRGAGTVVVPRSVDYDLTEQEAVRRLLADANPDLVVHLAAEVGGIGANRENPGRYFYANAAMGIHLIEESRKVGIEKFVQVGTVCSYPKFATVPFREDALWEGYPEETNAPYGIAKKSLLVMLDAYRQQYGFPGIYLLPVNLYGPGDNFDPQTSHVIPALIRKFTEARDAGQDKVVLWGTGSPSREFLYVDDAARAIVMAAEHHTDGEPMNVGTGREIRIADLAELIGRLTGFEGAIEWDSTKPDGQPRRCLDTSRARERLGFEAAVDLEEGLAKTISWWDSQVDAL
ncbi:MAG TPA: GDP-L-fucose synthase [Acidimicrobiia bacterium]|nr:GDP-L-fucose synthase [Acidimicrobiia bacterium]